MFPNIRLLMICISTPILHNETLFSSKLFSTTLQNVRTLHKLFTFIARSQYPRLSIRILGLSVTATSVLLRPTISTSTAATTATVIITGTTAGRFTHLEFSCVRVCVCVCVCLVFIPCVCCFPMRMRMC
jgi:hypothetical protein